MESKSGDRLSADRAPTTAATHEFSSDVPASVAVINAVSAVTGTDPVELPPLYETIDPDALNSLFEARDRTGSSPRVEFTYNGFDVTVRDGPRVTVERTDAA